jgi:hypothetical protein
MVDIVSSYHRVRCGVISRCLYNDNAVGAALDPRVPVGAAVADQLLPSSNLRAMKINALYIARHSISCCRPAICGQ